jgi:hypothetical protein
VDGFIRYFVIAAFFRQTIQTLHVDICLGGLALATLFF